MTCIPRAVAHLGIDGYRLTAYRVRIIKGEIVQKLLDAYALRIDGVTRRKITPHNGIRGTIGINRKGGNMLLCN